MSFGSRAVGAALAAAAIGCHPAARPSPQDWLSAGPRAVEAQFDLPAYSVRFDTATEPLVIQIPGDSAAYLSHVLWSTGSRIDTLRDVHRLDRRPDLSARFLWPAVQRLGYTEGRVESFEPLAAAVWRSVPRSVRLRALDVYFICHDEGCDGRHYWADSLDAIWPRRE